MSFRVGSRGAVGGSAPDSGRRGLGSITMSMSGSRVGSTPSPSLGGSWLRVCSWVAGKSKSAMAGCQKVWGMK